MSTTAQHIGSLGATRVREAFNHSGDELVSKIKRATADLIDLCEQHKNDKPTEDARNEAARLWALAQTAYEEAAMWAVKAATAASA